MAREPITRPATDAAPAEEGRREACLYVIAQGARPGEAPVRLRMGGLDEVAVGRGDATAVTVEAAARRAVVAIADERMSGRHARLASVGHRWRLEDRGSRNGTYVNGARVERATLEDGDVIDAGQTIVRYREQALGDVPVVATPAAGARGLVSIVPAVARELAELAALATSDLTILIEGETGTGKEVVARALHRRSARAGELVAVNCGALPHARAAAELFGWRRGAFTGAEDEHVGLVRAAHRGTLFLDEIGDLPLADQATLLRVLQEREVLPIGTARPVRVDLRVMAATHQPLDALVARGRFRADLLARLSGFRTTLPPLRERREDLGLLVADVLRGRGAAADGVTLHVDAWRALVTHAWPGNVRELELAIAQAIARRDFAGVIRAAHLPRRRDAEPPDDERVADARRAELAGLLRTHHGNIAEVARRMGKARMQIQRWLRAYQLDAEEFRR